MSHIARRLDFRVFSLGVSIQLSLCVCVASMSLLIIALSLLTFSSLIYSSHEKHSKGVRLSCLVLSKRFYAEILSKEMGLLGKTNTTYREISGILA